jgi:hypothetical protein
MLMLPQNIVGTTATWSREAYRLAAAPASRLLALVRLLDRAHAAIDDIAGLRQSAQFIAENLAELSKSAAGIDANSAEIAREITGLTAAAQGIDLHAGRLGVEIEAVAKIVPTLQRLTEIVDPLDGTVIRLGRLVDRLPRGGRRAPRQELGREDSAAP